MSSNDNSAVKVIPAHLDYLTIYNPLLGPTEDTEGNQILFYYCDSGELSKRDQDEQQQLRNIGVAQGMVNLARGFSAGDNVDCIDTEKRRIVLLELEPSWWILASINLTLLPADREPASSPRSANSRSVEYSSREVSPATLLLQQLQTAHQLFLFHHGQSLQRLYSRLSRSRFCDILHGYWFRFARHWDVLLHGSPAVEIYNGVKLAAGGELGVGVGEEDWGSGERDVLEGIVKGTEGLTDIMVFRLGDENPPPTKPAKAQQRPSPHHEPSKWIGDMLEPRAEDGAIFSGVGAITSTSQAVISNYIRSIYFFGEHAYGIKNSKARAGNMTGRSEKSQDKQVSGDEWMTSGQHDLAKEPHATASRPNPQERPSYTPSIPPPIVSAAEESLRKASLAAEATKSESDPSAAAQSFGSSLSNPDNWVKVFTLGYGSPWPKTEDRSDLKPKDDTFKAKGSQKPLGATGAKMEKISSSSGGEAPQKSAVVAMEKDERQSGWFIIGFKGNLDFDAVPEDGDDLQAEQWTERNMLRSVYVEVRNTHEQSSSFNSEHSESEVPLQTMPATKSSSVSAIKQLRIVVYAHQPFIYVLLFDRDAASPTLPSFFRILHHNLAPLHKPLLSSTSPVNVAKRLSSSLPSRAGAAATNGPPIYDLIFNPVNLHLRTSIPAIPLPGVFSRGSDTSQAAVTPPWARLDALNVHTQLLNTFAETRKNVGERERQSKTSRNWWLIWMRLPTTSSAADAEPQGTFHQEAFLIRKSGDHPSPRKVSARSGRSSLGMAMGMGMPRFMMPGGGSEESSSRAGSSSLGLGQIAEGFGLDPRKYVEGLLSLNR